ncbi:TetR/AcrR family transcriptional regulator [Chitinophagaceae bacterium LWZ2-11]
MIEYCQKDEILETEILSAAGLLFKEFGFKKTTMGDIAQYVGKGKSTLYYYYTGKEEIFEAVINHEMKEFNTEIQAAINKPFSAKQKLKAYCKARFQKLSQLCNLSEALLNEIAELQCILSKIRKRYESFQIDLIKRVMEEGVERGEFKKITRENIELFSYLMVCSFRGLSVPFTVEKKYPQMDHQIDTMVDIFVDGIGREN